MTVGVRRLGAESEGGEPYRTATGRVIAKVDP